MCYNHVYPRSSSANSESCNNSKSSSSREESWFKMYQFLVFCIPILFTFILLFVFYLFYIRPRRLSWSSLRTTTSLPPPGNHTVELGLKKELREMLPIIVYKESFSVRDTQCSVCLGDYVAEDRLQQIPSCGHTFHIDCIDSWLSTHSTCPLCRSSLLSAHKYQNESPDVPVEPSHESSVAVNNSLTSLLQMPQACEETKATEYSGLRNGEPTSAQNSSKEDASSEWVDCKRGLRDAGNATQVHQHTGGSSEAKKQLKYNKREDVSFDVDVLDLRISKGGGKFIPVPKNIVSGYDSHLLNE
ncbi:hypothetical protein PS2_033661 [Malus domestica]